MPELNNIYSDRDTIFKAREANLDQQRKSLQHLLDTISARLDKLYAEKKELNELKKELEIKESMINDGIKEEKIAREEFNQKLRAFQKEKDAFDKEHTIELERLHNETLGMELSKNNYEDQLEVLKLIIKKDKDGNVDHELIDALLGGYNEKVNEDKELREKLDYLEEYKFKLEKINEGLQEKISSLIEENKTLSESLDHKTIDLRTISEDARKALNENTSLIKELEELRETSTAKMKELKEKVENLEEDKEVLMQKIVEFSSGDNEEPKKDDVPDFGTKENAEENVPDSGTKEMSEGNADIIVDDVKDVPDFGTEVFEESYENEKDDFEEIKEQVQEESYAEMIKSFIEKNCLDFENVQLTNDGVEERLTFSSVGVNICIFFSDTPKFEVSVKREKTKRLQKLLKVKTDASKGKVSYRYENGFVYATSYFTKNTDAPVLVNDIRTVRQEFE